MAKQPRKLYELREYVRQLRNMDDAQLAAELEAHRARMVALRNQAVTEKVEDNSEFRRTRGLIARVKTELAARRQRARATA